MAAFSPSSPAMTDGMKPVRYIITGLIEALWYHAFDNSSFAELGAPLNRRVSASA